MPQVDRLGFVGARALTEGAHGVVEAVFERSFYIRTGAHWLCIGGPRLGLGPLNAVCAADLPEPSFGWVRPGDPVVCQGGSARIGNALTLGFDAAQAWSAPIWPEWNSETLSRGLTGFATALPEELPAAGLGGLLRAGPSSRVAVAATDAAATLRVLARSGARICAPEHAATLLEIVGLGPGLTPSGDDFLGGALIALRALGRTPLCDSIWNALRPELASRTNAISIAHLGAAAEGQGHAALHGLISDVLAGCPSPMCGRIAALAAIGHTSGWDALAGAVAVLRATAERREAICSPDERSEIRG